MTGTRIINEVYLLDLFFMIVTSSTFNIEGNILMCRNRQSLHLIRINCKISRTIVSSGPI